MKRERTERTTRIWIRRLVRDRRRIRKPKRFRRSMAVPDYARSCGDRWQVPEALRCIGRQEAVPDFISPCFNYFQGLLFSPTFLASWFIIVMAGSYLQKEMEYFKFLDLKLYYFLGMPIKPFLLNNNITDKYYPMMSYISWTHTHCYSSVNICFFHCYFCFFSHLPLALSHLAGSNFQYKQLSAVEGGSSWSFPTRAFEAGLGKRKLERKKERNPWQERLNIAPPKRIWRPENNWKRARSNVGAHKISPQSNYSCLGRSSLFAEKRKSRQNPFLWVNGIRELFQGK